MGSRGWPAPTIPDWVQTVGVAAAAITLSVTSGEAGARELDALGVGLLLVAAVPLLVRRQWPLATFTIQVAAVMTYLVMQYGGGAELPIILAGIYSLALAGRRWWALVFGVGIVGGATAYRILVDREDALNVTIGGSLVLLVALLGHSENVRRELRAETRRRLRVAEAEKHAEARARVAEERLRMAHELHDVMAHTITTMTVQAGAAADQLDRDPERARQALADMRGAARNAMSELRAIIAVLRMPRADQALAPAPTLGRLDELVATVEQTGLRVELVTNGALDRELPTAVEVTCYRLVQEALTNVIRHAGATRATVTFALVGADIHVDITDDGTGPPPADSAPGGFGLVGLSERVAAAGGRLEAGPLPHGGFRVSAVLPASAAVGNVAG